MKGVFIHKTLCCIIAILLLSSGATNTLQAQADRNCNTHLNIDYLKATGMQVFMLLNSQLTTNGMIGYWPDPLPEQQRWFTPRIGSFLMVCSPTVDFNLLEPTNTRRGFGSGSPHSLC